MKTEFELLDLYAKAYKTRSVEGIKDYIPAIIQYIAPESPPRLMIKSQFLAFLQNKFNGQKKYIPIEHESIIIVDNETTGKENIYIDFGERKEYLFSIDVNNGLFERITISNNDNNKFTEKKIILMKQIDDIPESRQIILNLQKSNYFIYFDSGMIMILEEDNPNEVIDEIINTNYPYEFCIGKNFNIQYFMNLIKSGFFVMSKYYIQNNTYIVEAMHHLSRAVLFFDRLHIKKSIKNILPQYELKENADFEKIVDKCIENHDDSWLTKPLVNSFKEIHRINDPGVTFMSFGLYRDGKLVAGEFGAKVGRIYSSYSGFYEEDNSGTAQMILTSQYLEKNGYAFWDLGMPIEYKKSIGAKILNLEDFIVIWRKYSSQNLDMNFEFEKYPMPKQNLTEEQLLWVLRNAYRYFYVEDIQEYLIDDFHYASQYVFDEITTKKHYLEYLKGKLKAIQKEDYPNNELIMEMAYDFHSNRPYLYMRQDINEALFIAKVKDGKFSRLDLCIPGLYSFNRKSEIELLDKAYEKFNYLYKTDNISDKEKEDIIKFIKNVCLQCRQAPAYICKKQTEERLTIEERQKYGFDGMGRKVIDAYKLLIAENPVFPDFVYSILDKMEKTAKFLKNNDRKAIIGEMGEIVERFKDIKNICGYYSKAITAYLHFENSDDERRRYIRTIINLAIENQDNKYIINDLLSLLKTLMIYHYDIFEEFYNDGLITLIKENIPIEEFEKFDKQQKEYMFEYEKIKTAKTDEDKKYKVEYVLYDYNEECKIGYGGTAYHKGFIIFYDNFVSIEDHEVDRDDWDDAWHGHHSKNIIYSEQYEPLISLLKIKYNENNIKIDSNIEKIMFLLKTKTEKTLFRLMLSVVQRKEGIMYGGLLTRTICGDKIVFHVDTSQYDDFYPDCDTCNYNKTEIFNETID